MKVEARGVRRAGWIATLAAAVIACDPRSPTPPTTTSSTPAGPKAVSIAIGGMRSPLVVGESLQLTATVSFSDGSTRDITREARWTTNEVATITAGLLTAVRAGFGNVIAVYISENIGENIGKSLDFFVNPAPPPVPEIRGIVHEAMPRPGLALAGVRVEIVDGPYAGRATTTDYDGVFQFFGIEQAGFDLWASKRGYDTTRYRIAELPRDRTPDIALPGRFNAATQRVEGTFAPECYEKPVAVLTRSIFFTPGRDGVLTMDWRVNTEEVAVNLWIGSTGIVPDRSFLPSQYSGSAARGTS